MFTVYQLDAFEKRVNYAATCIVRETDSRHRDACFEMGDDDCVVAALVGRTIKNPNSKLAKKLLSDEWRLSYKGGWMAVYEKLKHIPRHQLAEEAKRQRDAFKANCQARSAEQAKQQALEPVQAP
jgi:hypothetical protein